MLIYAPDHFGRHGFKRPPEVAVDAKSVNVGELDRLLPQLEAAHAVTRDGDRVVADLGALGIDRLLGGGTTTRSWTITVAHASRHAREKVTVAEPAAAPSPGAETPR
jgi:large subunit ribosomal protein L15